MLNYKTSIVVVTWNLPQYLDLCIRSIRMHTKEDTYEIIVVNNGQDEATKELLERNSDIVAINNRKNLGYCKAINQGVREARYDFVLLGSNDVITTPNWLDILLQVYKDNRIQFRIGLIGTWATWASGTQDVCRRNFENSVQLVNRLALGWTLTTTNSFWDVGGMDEKFPNLGGNYADDDLSRRYIEARYVNLLAPVLVFHFPSMTYRSGLLDHTKDLDEGKKYYNKKWGIR